MIDLDMGVFEEEGCRLWFVLWGRVKLWCRCLLRCMCLVCWCYFV